MQDKYRRLLQFESSQRRRLGHTRMVRYLINRRYYYGDNQDPDDVNQPLGIRYVPKIVQKHVHYLFGEWEGDIVDWVVDPSDKTSDQDNEVATNISRAIYAIMRRADADELFLKSATDGSIYGDSVLKGVWSQKTRGAAIDAILPEYYHAMWHALDTNETEEVLLAYSMDRQSSYDIFGTPGNPRFREQLSLLDPGLATVQEYWNRKEYGLLIDDEIVKTAENPYGFIPFIHIPNMGVNGEYYGFGDAEPIFEIQDEINMRVADFGDIINYHAHPITLVRNYFGRFSDLKTGPDVVWDMGREGEASYLEWDGPAPGVMQYLDLLMQILFDTTSLTGIAFGRTEMSQASGSALVVQMLPIVEIVRRKRALWGPKLSEFAKMLIIIEAAGMSSISFKEKYKFDITDLERFDIRPKWAPILPRDRAIVVNENVALLVNKARSITSALKDLGTDDPETERNKIMDDLRDFGRINNELQSALMESEADVNKELADHEASLGIGVGRVTSNPTKNPLNRDGGQNSTSAKGGSNEDS